MQRKLSSLGIYDGNILTYLRDGLRIRWVGGNDNGSTSSSRNVTCKVFDTYVTVYYSLPDYTITVKAGEGGTVRGGGVIESGQTTTLTAIPNSGYKFVKWSDGNRFTSNDVKYTIDRLKDLLGI